MFPDVCNPPNATCTAPKVRLTMVDQALTNALIIPSGQEALVATHAFTFPTTAAEQAEEPAVAKVMASQDANISVDPGTLLLCFSQSGFTAECCNGNPQQPGGVGLCQVTINDSPIPSLPVELTSFESTIDGEDIVLSWSTASELNNAGFAVEHARGDDEAFSELDFVEGYGTSNEEQTYTFRATGLDVGRHKFRLRQVDFDGASEYSEIIETTIELAGTHRLGAAYPNPFNPSTTFELIVGRNQQVQIDIINALGQRVERLYDGVMEANDPKNFVFEAQMLPTGLYFYRVVGENFAETKQMLLVK